MFSIFCSFAFDAALSVLCLGKERNDKNNKRKKMKENRDISARARTGTSTVGHSGDVVFYASAIVVVILVRLSRDAGRQCCFFFAIRVACSKHE
jgi:hypothetical protein